MALPPGTRIGSYELVAAIGAGGMGEVYRARDTRLGREVAIKVLPESVSADRERLARFEREATVLASLNHVNIAHVYGLEKFGDALALVMELVEGDDLSLSIAAGPLGVDQSVAIALQIVDALAAAHERGIVHRDLKPANIKLRRDGIVKVLDFGLAKAATPHANDDATMTRQDLTEPGVIVGTAAYMSPEQIAGDAVDSRTDVWAFGCVLFEMLSSRRPFEATSRIDRLSAVLRSEPDYSAIAKAPAHLQSLIRRCLQKDRTKRLGHIADARWWLEDAGTVTAPTAAPTAKSSRWMVLGAIALAVASMGVAGWSLARTTERPAPVMRLHFAPDAPLTMTGRPTGVNFAVSPDGQTLIYHTLSADSFQLVRRRLDSIDITPIAGTDRAQNPAFSPDGTRIAFYSRGAIRTVALSGGTPSLVCELHGTAPFITWPDGGSIYFIQAGQSLMRVAESGGTATAVARPDPQKGEAEFFGLKPLPGGAVATFVRILPGASATRRLAAYVPSTGEMKTLVADSGIGVYGAGFLLFSQENVLKAARFDERRLEVIGAPFTVLDFVPNQFEIANDGTIMYVPKGIGGPPRFHLNVLTHTGAIERTIVSKVLLPRHTRLSPDGSHLALTIGALNAGEVWNYALQSHAQPIKLTFRSPAGFPVWSADGRELAYQRRTEKGLGMVAAPADGSVLDPQTLLDGDDLIPEDWTPDGRSLIYQATTAKTGSDLMLLDRSTGQSRPWLQSPFNEAEARVGAGGRWVAYVSDQTGRAEVWIRAFDGSGAPVRVSEEGGHEPRWSPSGKGLYFVNGESMMAVDVSLTPTVTASAPRLLFQGGFMPYNSTYRRTYDVTPDDRFIVVKSDDVEPNQPLVVLLNALAGKR